MAISSSVCFDTKYAIMFIGLKVVTEGEWERLLDGGAGDDSQVSTVMLFMLSSLLVPLIGCII